MRLSGEAQVISIALTDKEEAEEAEIKPVAETET